VLKYQQENWKLAYGKVIAEALHFVSNLSFISENELEHEEVYVSVG
jgi:hypothetical protein